MAFRTNKMPDLQEKSASGAVATFNTALAMPLVECKTEFMCTQSGSGTVSPTNPRPFVPVTNVVLTANADNITANFGANRYGGNVDFVNKKQNDTHIKRKISECYWSVLSSSNGWFNTQILAINAVRNDILTEYYKKVTSYYDSQNIDMSIYKADSNLVFIHDSRFSDATSLVNAMGDYGFVVQLTTPIVHDLSDIPTLSTIIGNNSFASDSGNIELKYKDLDIAKRGNFREVFKLPS